MMDLKDYPDLLKRYSELQRRLVNHRMQRFNDLINNYQEWYEGYYDRNRSIAPTFNPLCLLNVEFDELTHSKILGWLLDSHDTHNQGDLFFKHFLTYF